MWKKLLPFSLALFMASSLFAADVKLQWDAKLAADARIGVRIYEKFTSPTGVFTYAKIGTVLEPVSTFTATNVALGTHTYVVRAYSDQDESADSAAVIAIILAQVNGVTGLTITIVPSTLRVVPR